MDTLHSAKCIYVILACQVSFRKTAFNLWYTIIWLQLAKFLSSRGFFGREMPCHLSARKTSKKDEGGRHSLCGNEVEFSSMHLRITKRIHFSFQKPVFSNRNFDNLNLLLRIHNFTKIFDNAKISISMTIHYKCLMNIIICLESLS